MKHMFCVALLLGLITACGAEPDPIDDLGYDVEADITCHEGMSPPHVIRGCLNDAGCPADGACYTFACVDGTCEVTLTEEGGECEACGILMACTVGGACALQ